MSQFALTLTSYSSNAARLTAKKNHPLPALARDEWLNGLYLLFGRFQSCHRTGNGRLGAVILLYALLLAHAFLGSLQSTLGTSAFAAASARAIGRSRFTLQHPVLNFSVCTAVRNTPGRISIRCSIAVPLCVIVDLIIAHCAENVQSPHICAAPQKTP